MIAAAALITAIGLIAIACSESSPSKRAIKTPEDIKESVEEKPHYYLHNLNEHVSNDWRPRDGSNQNHRNNTFRPDKISFRDGLMIITLDSQGCPDECGSHPYASGEYMAVGKKEYGYGLYEAQLKAASGTGLATSFNLFTVGPGKKPFSFRISITIPGNDCRTVQPSWGENHSNPIQLGFDACRGFHKYGFEWKAGSLAFYVDGTKVLAASGDFAYPAGWIHANLWAGSDEVTGRLGGTYAGSSATAEWDWIGHTPAQ
jgi:endo-1,3-1,4-beta-glycanase ExoK